MKRTVSFPVNQYRDNNLVEQFATALDDVQMARS